MGKIPENLRLAYEKCEKVSYKRIYKSKDVVDIEIAGYNIIYTLIKKLTDAVFNEQKAYSTMLLPSIPEQYHTTAETPYGKLQSVLDYVSGMTDIYALELYRKINGMSLPTL